MALEDIGLAYSFDPLVREHLKEKRLKRGLASFPGFYLHYPSRRHQSTQLHARIDDASRRN